MKLRTLAVVSLFIITACGKDANPLSPEALDGRWNLVTRTNKFTNTVQEAGVPIEIGNGVTESLTAFLKFDGDKIAFIADVTITTQFESVTEREQFFGTYFIEGAVITLLSEDGEPFRSPIERSGDLLTIEDSDDIFVYEKTEIVDP